MKDKAEEMEDKKNQKWRETKREHETKNMGNEGRRTERTGDKKEKELKTKSRRDGRRRREKTGAQATK